MVRSVEQLATNSAVQPFVDKHFQTRTENAFRATAEHHLAPPLWCLYDISNAIQPSTRWLYCVE